MTATPGLPPANPTAPTAGPTTRPARPATALDLLHRILAARPGSEVRPQQEAMVTAVAQAIATRRHLIGQAGTGVGKTLSYLIPALHSGKRVVVSTATKQLGEQIVTKDLPLLAAAVPAAGGRAFTYALLKGRANYLCRRDVDALVNLDSDAPAENNDLQALFETAETSTRRPSKNDLRDLNALLQWAESTPTGDRADGPAVSDRSWAQVSTDSAGCVGARACPFGETCFPERARRAARDADVVVTNHAQVALDLESDTPLLGTYEVLVADEVHELETYLSSAWGLEVSPSGIKHQVGLAARRLPRSEAYEQAREMAPKIVADLAALDEHLRSLDAGLAPTLPDHVTSILGALAHRLTDLGRALDAASEDGGITAQVAAERKGAAGTILGVAASVASVLLITEGVDVRWIEAGGDRRGPTIKSAPLWVGERLQEALGDKTLIATSATVTVGGSFDTPIRTLGMGTAVTGPDGKPAPARGFDTIDVGTPFDYQRAAILYVPAPPFPEPVYAQRQTHDKAVLDDLLALVTAAGGRALALFTTTRKAADAAAFLRQHLRTPVLAQGEAPAQQLIDQFAQQETATLCATRGMWHGVDVPGPSLSLVVMNALPFTPPSDPLSSARATAIGARGYTEVFVANAAVALAQGAGRLIRSSTDRGVVAILDPRLLDPRKQYGQTLMRSLPPMRVFRDRAVVEGALSRLAAAADQATGTTRPAGRTGAQGGPATPTNARPAAGRAASAGSDRPKAPSRASTRALARTVKGRTAP